MKIDLNNLKEGQWLSGTEANLIKIINFAIDSKKSIKIEYKDAKSNRTTRTVYPLSIVSPYKNKYSSRGLSSHCTLRNDYRYFVIRRIQSIQIGNAVPTIFRRNFNSQSITRINRIKEGDYNFGESLTQTSRPKKQESISSSSWFWIIFWIFIVFLIVKG